MLNHKPRVLVVTSDERWRDSCTQAFRAEGCEVNTVPGGLQALDVLQRNLFDIVVTDDSYSNMGPIEFLFNVRDLASNEPFILLGGNGLERFEDVWRRCNVFFTGSKDRLLSAIPDSIERVYSRSTRPADVIHG